MRRETASFRARCSRAVPLATRLPAQPGVPARLLGIKLKDWRNPLWPDCTCRVREDAHDLRGRARGRTTRLADGPGSRHDDFALVGSGNLVATLVRHRVAQLPGGAFDPPG
jgi:hypothetical protein